MKDRSRVVHHPEVSHEGFRSLAVPTYRASTIVFEDAASYSARKHRGPDGYSYGLHGTPTTRTLEVQLSMLEGAERTVIMPSGQCAIAMIFHTVLRPGERVLIPDTAYPPVRGFCMNFLEDRGIDHVVYNPQIGAGIADLIDESTKLVWMESPGSTTMELQDIPAITAAAKRKGVLTGCDNTWATPLLFKPLAHGVDFSMVALTKYIGGHSDLLLGSVAVADIALQRRLKDTMRMHGIGVSPDDCQMALRGLETMAVRIDHMGRVATDFARRIEDLPGVKRVLHPALTSCPGHELWERDFKGASGVFSIVLEPETEAFLEDALSAFKIFAIGASWGGTRSLVAPMSVRDDRVVTPWKEQGTILRLSIGLEDPEDLWSDIARFFESLATKMNGTVSASEIGA